MTEGESFLYKACSDYCWSWKVVEARGACPGAESSGHSSGSSAHSPTSSGLQSALGLTIHPLYLQPSDLPASSWISPVGGTASWAETGRQKMSNL